MKKFTLIFLALALSVPAAFSSSGLGLSASYWDTADAGDSWGAGTKLSLQMVEGVQFDFRASFFNGLGESHGDYDVNLDVTPLEVGLALLYPVGDRVDLYMGGGVGYYLVDGDGTGPAGVLVEVDPDDEVGFYLLGGVEYILRRSGAVYGETEAGLYLEAVYRSVSIDSARVDGSGPVRVSDADLDGIGMNAGLVVRW